jgi:hypothetical protein
MAPATVAGSITAMLLLFPNLFFSHLRINSVNTFLAGYEHILREVKDCAIVPFYLHGLWESKFSNAADRIKQSGRNI